MKFSSFQIQYNDPLKKKKKKKQRCFVFFCHIDVWFFSKMGWSPSFGFFSFTRCDGARKLWALGRWRHRGHQLWLQKSGCQRSATGRAKELPFTAKPKAGSQLIIKLRCLLETSQENQSGNQFEINGSMFLYSVFCLGIFHGHVDIGFLGC